MPVGWGNGQEVLTGPHVIEITAAGYQSKHETVTIPAGAKQTMKVELERLPPPSVTGTLNLDATPADTALTLDGTAMGSAKDFRQELSAGIHEVEISAAGYEIKTRDCDDTRGRRATGGDCAGETAGASRDGHLAAGCDPRRCGPY